MSSEAISAEIASELIFWVQSRGMRGVAAFVLCGLLCLAPAGAAAQGRWQVDLVGGLSIFELPTSGDAALPSPGPTLPTSSPTNPSRRVPTWFLGDGASLLNGTNAEFGVPSRLVPLDDALGRLGLSGSNAPVFGVRIRRQFSSRLALEAGAEIHAGAAEMDEELLDAVEAARAGFQSAFTDLLTTGPFTNVSVNASSQITGQSSRELALTAAVRFIVRPGPIAPYVTLGGGLIERIGDLPRIVLSGGYRFTVLGQTPFAESDTLTLRYDQSAGLVGIAGAGLQSRLSDRLSVTIDGRAYIGPQTLTLRLDSAPTVTTGTPAGFIESFTTPAVQFSNNSSTGRASTLSGTPLNGFTAFSSSGVQVRYVVTAGVTVRF